MSDYIWGAAKPAPDGFISPSAVSRTDTEEGAEHRCEVLGEGFVVVRAEAPAWRQVSPGATGVFKRPRSERFVRWLS